MRHFIPYVITFMVMGGIVTSSLRAEAPPQGQPKLGFTGTIVDMPKDFEIPAPEGLPNRGIRVDRVNASGPAAKMGLERGDIIVAIDIWRFTTLEGYLQALRCAEQRPSIYIRNVRNGKLIRRTIDLPHQVNEEECMAKSPHTYWIAIDLEEDMRE